jgi:hypothetical protein
VKITTKGAKLLFEVLPGCYHVLNGAMWPLDGKTKKALITIVIGFLYDHSLPALIAFSVVAELAAIPSFLVVARHKAA